jgi:hypothetical protein
MYNILTRQTVLGNGFSIYRDVQKVFGHCNVLLYISYKTKIFQNIIKYSLEAQILNIHDLNTSLNYLSSNVLSLYCIFDVLCLTRELIKFIDYKIMLKLQCKATLILPLLEKNHQNRTRVDLGIMFFFKCGFI